jgi:hypothetical protein
MHGENLQLIFPVSLVKNEERVVVGVATADNVDKSGDVVDFSASMTAFKNWQGNIREMHQPLAVGKAVGHRPVEINENGTIYKGVEVSAYISKGAEDTWQKVLDGTLGAFSIGGRILERKDDETRKFRGQPVSVVTKYELGELSLVDNPANPVANITLIKSDDDGLSYALAIDEVECNKIGDTIVCITDDIITKTECDCGPECNCEGECNCNTVKDLHNKNYSDMVTYMEDTDVLATSDETSSSDGAFEGIELEEKISLLQRFLTWMSDPANAESDVVVDSDEDDVEKITAEVEEITLVAEINEGDDIDMNIDELTAALGTVIDEKLASHSEASATKVETLIEEKLASAINAMTEKQDELTAKVDESTKSVTDSLDVINTRVETVENAGAIKKSVDETDEVEETVAKTAEQSAPESFWGNLFLPQDLIKSLGYES